MVGEGDVLGGKYRLIKRIGQGGMGAVWHGERLDLGSSVAIKVMHADAAQKRSSAERFGCEARAAATLTSPHVVQVLDYGVDEETNAPYIVMELLQGESLSSRLADGPVNASVCADWVTQISRALTNAHSHGIVHRDLKPANIFLVRNEDAELVKLLDFGIAKSSLGDVATVTGSMVGTPYYMSPEQVNGASNLDHRTDLWSLAIIACECLTGRRPFAEDTLSGLAMQISLGRTAKPSTLSAVPEGFDQWFFRATEVKPERRFQSALEMAKGLQALANNPLHETPPPAGLDATLNGPDSSVPAEGVQSQGPPSSPRHAASSVQGPRPSEAGAPRRGYGSPGGGLGSPSLSNTTRIGTTVSVPPPSHRPLVASWLVVALAVGSLVAGGSILLRPAAVGEPSVAAAPPRRDSPPNQPGRHVEVRASLRPARPGLDPEARPRPRDPMPESGGRRPSAVAMPAGDEARAPAGEARAPAGKATASAGEPALPHGAAARPAAKKRRPHREKHAPKPSRRTHLRARSKQVASPPKAIKPPIDPFDVH